MNKGFTIRGANKVAGVSAMRGVSVNTGINVEAALRILAQHNDVSVNSLANQAFEFVLTENAKLLATLGVVVADLNYPRTTGYRKPRAPNGSTTEGTESDSGSTQDNGEPGLTVEPTVVEQD